MHSCMYVCMYVSRPEEEKVRTGLFKIFLGRITRRDGCRYSEMNIYKGSVKYAKIKK